MLEADLSYELSYENRAANQNQEKSLAKDKLTIRQRQVESSNEDYLRHSSILVDDSRSGCKVISKLVECGVKLVMGEEFRETKTGVFKLIIK